MTIRIIVEFDDYDDEGQAYDIARAAKESLTDHLSIPASSQASVTVIADLRVEVPAATSLVMRRYSRRASARVR